LRFYSVQIVLSSTNRIAKAFKTEGKLVVHLQPQTSHPAELPEEMDKLRHLPGLLTKDSHRLQIHQRDRPLTAATAAKTSLPKNLSNLKAISMLASVLQTDPDSRKYTHTSEIKLKNPKIHSES
jgi:hypothetical protein